MRSPVHSYLLSLHETVYGTDPFAASRLSRHRTVAAAEPEAHAKVLYGADPTQLGIAMTMADGHTYQVGDADVEFSIQSISKVFVYALALMDSGFDTVDSKIDVEPSGSVQRHLVRSPAAVAPRTPSSTSVRSRPSPSCGRTRGRRCSTGSSRRRPPARAGSCHSTRTCTSRSWPGAPTTGDWRGSCPRGGSSTAIPWTRSTTTRGSAPSPSLRRTCPSWPRPWPTWVSIRSQGSACSRRTSSSACCPS